MVKFYSCKDKFDNDFATVSLAFFLRYPNPYSKHVIASDTISRHVDSEGRLHSSKLILKQGKLPKWSRAFLGKIDVSFVLERSIVDPKKKIMFTTSQNVDHTKIMKVMETVTYKENGKSTDVQTEVSISSQFGFVKNRIEAWGQMRFGENLSRSRQGMRFVIEKLKESGYRFNKLQLALQSATQQHSFITVPSSSSISNSKDYYIPQSNDIFDN